MSGPQGVRQEGAGASDLEAVGFGVGGVSLPFVLCPGPLAYFSLAEGTEWLQGERRGSPELCRNAGQTLQPCSGPLDADVSVSVWDRAVLGTQLLFPPHSSPPELQGPGECVSPESFTVADNRELLPDPDVVMRLWPFASAFAFSPQGCLFPGVTWPSSGGRRPSCLSPLCAHL